MLSINELLNDERSAIAELCKKAATMRKISHQLKKHLDPSLKNHFELANINNTVATLLVGSSSQATRLRYNIPTILEVMNKQLNFSSVKTIRIKVKKIIPDNTATNKKPIPLSEKSAEILVDVANNSSDSRLRACFLKLSKNYHK